MSPRLVARISLGNLIPQILKIILLWIQGSRMREGRISIYEGPEPRSRWHHLDMGKPNGTTWTWGSQMELILVVQGI